MTKAATPTALDRLKRSINGIPGGQFAGGPAENPPQTVTGPLGTVPGAAVQVDTTREVPQPAPLSAKDADRLMQGELLSAMRSIVESSTEIAGRLKRRGAVNGVMESWAGVFPASGVIARQYEVSVGSVSVANLDPVVVITVASGVPAGDTGGQTAGVGVSYIRANADGRAPIGDHGFTLTGNPGAKVSFEVWLGLQAYGVDSL